MGDKEIKDRRLKIEDWKNKVQGLRPKAEKQMENWKIGKLEGKFEDQKGLSLRACGEAILLRNETKQGLLQASKVSKSEYISNSLQKDCRTSLRYVRNDRLGSLLATFLILSFFFFLLSFAAGQTTELERQVFDISRELRCPVCTSESVADSNGDVSVEMREIIQEQLTQGKSREEIMAYFQASYGDWILLDPPKSGVHLVVWLLPLIAGAIGTAMLAYFFRRWTLRSAVPVEASEDELRRVREALEQ